MKLIVGFLFGIVVSAGIFLLVAHRTARSGEFAIRLFVPRNTGDRPAAKPMDDTKVRPVTMPVVANSSDLAAFQSFLAEKKTSNRYNKFYAYLDEVGPARFKEILAEIQSAATSPSDKKLLLGALLQKWTETDPHGVARIFTDLSLGEKLNSIDLIASTWAASDPGAALTWAESLPPSQLRSSAVGHALAKLAETDLPGALARLDRLDAATARWAGAEIYSDWAERDPSAAARAALELAENGHNGEWALQSVASTWARVDPTAALKWATGGALTNTPYGINIAMAAVSVASGIDPRSTVQAIWEQSGAAQADMLRIVALKSWLDQDPSAATQWVNGLEIGSRTQFVLSASRMGDPASVAAWLPLVEALPSSPARTEAYQNLVTQWASVQPENAINHLKTLNDPELTGKLMPNLAAGLASTAPDSALSLALSLPPGSERQQALASIGSVWATKEPAKAAERIATLEANADQAVIAASVAGTWAANDPNAAFNWSRSLTSIKAHDSSLQAIVSALSQSYPELAATAAAAVSDPVAHENAVVSQARLWLKTDPAAADRWIRSSLTPAQQQKVLASAHRR